MTERSQYRPTSVSPPGETLAELLEERGLTQAELATRTGRPLKTINEIVKGKAAITAETALQLERVLGAPAEFWTAREARWQEWRARQAEARQLAKDTGWLRELPVADMVRFGWIPKVRTLAERVLECLRFFGVSSVLAWRAQYERPSAAWRAGGTGATAVGATAAWLRAGERGAAVLECRPFDRERFRRTLAELRALTREPDFARVAPALVEACAACGVAVVFAPTPKGCPKHGATRWLSPEKALLLLSLRYGTDDQFWFTFFHEAAHLLLHGKKLVFVDGEDGLDDPAEQEAHRFARDHLIPPARAAQLAVLGWSREAVRAFAEQVGVSAGVVVGRMQKDGLLPWSHRNDLKARYERPGGEDE
jgi:addiction module HigA family antidote